MKTKYPDWMSLIEADPDGFMLPAESSLLDPTLFWYVHDLKETDAGGVFGDAEVCVYAGLGSIKLEEFKSGILFTYCELNVEWDGSPLDSSVMFAGARVNFQRILDGKIKFGFEKQATQLSYVNSKRGDALKRLVTKYQEAFGLETMEKTVEKIVQKAQRKRRKGKP